ncbi:hypothetical protein VDG37_01550 [Xanthomonas campestris pv. raphani]|uniref:hypothetical protein n=1 Tax=Xanthomonas campestris TaxID=339 RepID=UPI002B23705E|nr:hypothetical protein [Xanthomonas campestris]MEA9830464.1 hypothetical protein [Xanthomonas campestris pv. raphani]MEA9951441.1 hypothetical protein [Xanthomonas campestris pv. raphani]
MSVLYPTPLSATFVDHLIWNIGLLNTPNNERNFLRGIHSPASLSSLMSYLSSHQPGRAMRLTSTWVDKHPQAHPFSGAKNCEVGDLLVLWRQLDARGKVLRRVGWMLQAKMADAPERMNHRDSSSVKEYALYEESANWHFELKHATQNLGSFDLAKDTDLDPAIILPAGAQHWSYLQIRNPKAVAAWTTPLQARWDSSGVGCWLEGLADSIASMMDPSPGKGAVLDAVNPQWTALCDALETFAASRDSRLAGGLWQHSCMALAVGLGTMPGFTLRLPVEELLGFPATSLVSYRGDSGFEGFTATGGAPKEPDRVSTEFDGGGGLGVIRVDSIGPEEGEAG